MRLQRGDHPLTRLRLLAACLALVLAGCQGSASPPAVAGRVGNSLDNASVATGNALDRAGNATGSALQRAGNSVQRATSP